MSAMARTAAWACGMALSVLLGCDVTPKGPPRPARTGDAGPGSVMAAWPFAPARIEVHPLTRLVPSATGPGQIEAHVELRDRFGDEVKGLGELLIELYEDAGPVSGVGERRQIATWRFNLTDLDANDRAYDNVTRTYRLDLTEVPTLTTGEGRLRLRATLTTPGGVRLSAERRLSVATPGSALDPAGASTP